MDHWMFGAVMKGPRSHRRRAIAGAAAALCAALTGLPQARAEGTGAAVIPVTKSDDRRDPIEELAKDVRAELGRRHEDVLSPDALAERFRTAHSRQPASTSQELLRKLKTASQAAELAWVTDRSREALIHVAEAQELTQALLETQEPQVRDLAARACVAGIQAHLKDGQRSRAVALGVWWISSFPKVDFRRVSIRPVKQVLAEAQDELAAGHAQPLEIDSTPSGCALYLQGAKVGQTPHRIAHPARREYVVQVDCGAGFTSRVHRIHGTKQKYDIDLALDHAVVTESESLRLRYDVLDETRLRDHVQRVGIIVGVRQAMAIDSPSPERLTIRLVPGGAVDLPLRYTREKLVHEMDQLLHENQAEAGPAAPRAPRNVEQESAQGAPSSAALPLPPQVTPPERRWRIRLGASLAGVGAAGFLASGLLLRRRATAGERFAAHPTTLARERAWDSARPPPYFLAAAGAAVASVGAALLSAETEPDEHKGLSYTMGALSLAGAATGAALIVTAERCPERIRRTGRCILGAEQVDVGAIVLLATAPFVTFSASQLIRWIAPPSGRVHLEAAISRETYLLRATHSF